MEEKDLHPDNMASENIVIKRGWPCSATHNESWKLAAVRWSFPNYFVSVSPSLATLSRLASKRRL